MMNIEEINKKPVEELTVSEGIYVGLTQALAIKRGEMEPSRVIVFEVPNCKSIREKAGYTQDKFAKALNVPMATIKNWEQGRNNPTGAAATLLRLIDINPDIINVLI